MRIRNTNAKARKMAFLTLGIALFPLSPGMAQLETTPEFSDVGDANNDTMSQITNVSQLRDVSPQDWAYEALKSLIERYDCVEGYPNNTYRGDRTLTRYEFAAALSSCLEKVERQFTQIPPDAIRDLELATIERLQEEFVLELSLVRGQVDAVQARTAELELTQFSTTTQLQGQVFLNLTSPFTDGTVLAEGDKAFRQQSFTTPGTTRSIEKANTTFSYLAFLNLHTSFTGRDNLTLQLAAGNANSPANEFASAGVFNTFGVPFTEQTPALAQSDLVIRELSYRFPIGDRIQAVVGPQIDWYNYFDSNRFTDFRTGASSFNATHNPLLNAVDRGTGAIASWAINEQFMLSAGYLADSNEFLPFRSASNPKEGLFNGTNTITTELTYSPSDRLNLRFLYNRSSLEAINGQIGGALGEPILGFAANPSGGNLDDATANTFSVNADWLITDSFGIFGRYGYATTNLKPINEDIEAQAFQVGVAFPDLLKEGALATVSYVVPFSVLEGRDLLISGGGDGGTQYEVEASYYYPVTEHFSLVPAFYFIGNANNFSDNPNIYIANLRAQLNF